MRLDRFLASATGQSRNTVLRLLAGGRVKVNGMIMLDGGAMLSPFVRIQLDDEVLHEREARYFMFHKPAGCVSATADPRHPTVMDFFAPALQGDLHIAGRLDFNTTGLMLLTNDGRWSAAMTDPVRRKPKVYYVETEDDIDEGAVELFAQGMYFGFEGITTQPAGLELLGSRSARLTLYEGRYHQVKRMFGRFNNKVTRLHRESMGHIRLDAALAAGEYRALTPDEIEGE